MKRLQNKKYSPWWTYSIAIALLLTAITLGLALGSTAISPSEVWNVLVDRSRSDATARIVRYVRLPRTVAALLCGAALSVSGAVIQGVLANRLASPSVIGVNAGAGLAVTLCAACGVLSGWKISLFAFLGAFATVMLVSFCAKLWGASRSTVILMGVAMNSLLGAFSDTVITLEPTVGLTTSAFKIGDFSSVTYAKLIPSAVGIVAALLILLTLANELDVLTLGEERAQGLGLHTGAWRVIFLALAAVLAGAAVSLAGLLSFVGLLVPHAVRRIAGPESRSRLLLCALYGAGFVALSDTLARTLFAPYELPVGILMAFLGAPFFLFILIRGKGGRSRA